MKQVYELGETVFAFKATPKEMIIAKGIIKGAEINSGGYIQYQIITMDEQNEKHTILANHASMARDEAEIKQKMQDYKQFENEQKEIYEKKFGKPEFNQDIVEVIKG